MTEIRIKTTVSSEWANGENPPLIVEILEDGQHEYAYTAHSIKELIRILRKHVVDITIVPYKT